MVQWWESLDNFLKVLYCITIPSTILLVIQTIITILGYDGGGDGLNPDLDLSSSTFVHDDLSALHHLNIDDAISADIDFGDGTDFVHHMDDGTASDFNHDMSDASDFKLFTFQGIVAFFCVFGWTSIGGIRGGANRTVATLIGVIFGIIIMLVIAKLIHWSRNLVQSGTLDIRNALGEPGEVYLVIPPQGSGYGKVNVTVQGRLIEMNAVTYQTEKIDTGTLVRVIDIKGDVLVVEKN